MSRNSCCKSCSILVPSVGRFLHFLFFSGWDSVRVSVADVIYTVVSLCQFFVHQQYLHASPLFSIAMFSFQVVYGIYIPLLASVTDFVLCEGRVVQNAESSCSVSQLHLCFAGDSRKKSNCFSTGMFGDLCSVMLCEKFYRRALKLSGPDCLVLGYSLLRSCFPFLAVDYQKVLTNNSLTIEILNAVANGNLLFFYIFFHIREETQ